MLRPPHGAPRVAKLVATALAAIRPYRQRAETAGNEAVKPTTPISRTLLDRLNNVICEPRRGEIASGDGDRRRAGRRGQRIRRPCWTAGARCPEACSGPAVQAPDPGRRLKDGSLLAPAPAEFWPLGAGGLGRDEAHSQRRRGAGAQVSDEPRHGQRPGNRRSHRRSVRHAEHAVEPTQGQPPGGAPRLGTVGRLPLSAFRKRHGSRGPLQPAVRLRRRGADHAAGLRRQRQGAIDPPASAHVQGDLAASFRTWC